ncbi:hypothetical protein [Catenovulum adriaticum]|uniref:Uncharacterized protein n=1 Tax=Catenovulum adriaticum TaxID=2984846 RepID=A0ABY7AN29_9ALTE|nr:hypothetical protein [Catenovulum sp. TS8]WAJ70914.1 hypothetical protein OLW01_03685 [Catenovulum sp. TS8]
MFKPLLRLSILASIWLKFGKQIVLGLLIIIALTILQFISHDINEYLNTTKQTQYLGYVLIAKWCLILAIVVSYLLYIKYSLKSKRATKLTQASKQANSKQASLPKNRTNEHDPFAHLRDKKKLRSKGDLLIEKQKQSK